jgi:hypothetical protein
MLCRNKLLGYVMYEHHTFLISTIFQSWCTKSDWGGGGGGENKNYFFKDKIFFDQPPKTQKRRNNPLNFFR